MVFTDDCLFNRYKLCQYEWNLHEKSSLLMWLVWPKNQSLVVWQLKVKRPYLSQFQGQSAPRCSVGKVCSSSWILASQMLTHDMCKMVHIAVLFDIILLQKYFELSKKRDNVRKAEEQENPLQSRNSRIGLPDTELWSPKVSLSVLPKNIYC